MKTQILSFLIFLLFCGVISGQQNNKVEFKITKGPCKGTCSVYSLEVVNGEYLIYTGIDHTPRKGAYKKGITKKMYNYLAKAFQEANFSVLKKNYESQVPDLQLVTITDFNVNRSVSGKEKRPQAVLAIEDIMSRLAENNDGWTKVKKRAEEEEDDNPKYDGNEIIILTKDSFKSKLWLQKYEKYNLLIVKKITPGQNYYLTRYNAKITADQMLKIILQDPDIISAQFNQEVTPRN